jgi:capping protein beta
MVDPLDCALDLMRRLPPTNTEDNLANLIDLAPDLCEQLLSSVDQPLRIAYDKFSKKDYLLCDYNRDGDSYRSPWSNRYDPPLDDGAVPSDSLRKIEIQLNEVFDIYRELYYEGGLSSAYCWDLDDGFACVVLIKKTQDATKKGIPMKGTWDAIHVIEVGGNKKTAHYKLTSTVMLSIETDNKTTGLVNLAGNLTRQDERDMPIDPNLGHITNIGRMIEDMELKLRNGLETVYFGKTKDIVNTLRTSVGVSVLQNRRNMSNQIQSALGK